MQAGSLNFNFCQVGNGRDVFVRTKPAPHVVRGRKTLQTHGFPMQTYL